MTAGANGSLVCLLQRENVDRRQQFSICESLRRNSDQIADVLRTAREAYQPELAQHAAGNQVRPACVTNVVRRHDEAGTFGIRAMIARMLIAGMIAELEFFIIRERGN